MVLFTPDPYLAFLFKDLFARYGHVGVAPCKSRGQYWILLPLKSFAWFLGKEVLAHIDEQNVYDTLSVAIDVDGTVNAWKTTRTGTVEFSVTLYNEKKYIIEPLYHALTRLECNLRTSKIPKGRMTSFGSYDSDCYSLTICSKANVKRLLEHLQLAPPHKRLKARLKRPGGTSLPGVYWAAVR